MPRNQECYHAAYYIGLEAMQKIADAGIDDITGVEAIQEAAKNIAAKNKRSRIDAEQRRTSSTVATISKLINFHALDGLGVTFTVDDLAHAALGSNLGQDRWIKKNLGDKKEAGEALRWLFYRNHWRPQDIADAMNLKGRTVRRYTRGETAFDAAFLLGALHVMASSPTAGLLPPLTREEN